jgi:Zn-dependent peptidase ImmA (M78 family)
MKKNNTREKVAQKLQEVRDKYNIHGRAFTKRDFYRICRGENIALLNKTRIPKSKWYLYGILDSSLRGFLLPIKDRRYIFLRSFFGGKFELHTAFHELGHFFMGHCEMQVGYNVLSKDFSQEQYRENPMEREADMFARMAIREVRNGR